MLRRRGNYAVWPEKYEFILYLGKHKNLVIVTTRAKRATVELQYSVISAANYTKSNYNLSQGLFCLHTSHLETKLQVILIQMYICQIQENLGSVSCMHLL